MTHDLSYRRILGRMGYYRYQDGLIFHHINQEGQWDDHLVHCRDFILRAIGFYKPDKITVLGSGWLMDLPIAEIIENTPEVCLVDIIHPPDVIMQLKDFRNVNLIESDLTGGLIAEVWQKTRKYSYLRKLKSLEGITIPEPEFSDDPGMIISLNIITQLESLIVDFIRKRSRISEAEFLQFRKDIQQKHIDFLMKHKSVILTDCEEIITDKSGAVNIVPTLLAALPERQVKDEWTWDFDRPGGDLYNSRSQFRVVAQIN
jgi:hypothetical protein